MSVVETVGSSAMVVSRSLFPSENHKSICGKVTLSQFLRGSYLELGKCCWKMAIDSQSLHDTWLDCLMRLALKKQITTSSIDNFESELTARLSAYEAFSAPWLDGLLFHTLALYPRYILRQHRSVVEKFINLLLKACEV